MKRRIVLSLIFYFLLICPSVLGETITPPTITPPWTWKITSDYGPRIPPPGGSWFHRGIDYDGPKDANIYPVEGGTIFQIKYGGGWHIDVRGTHGLWMYLHIFSGDGTQSPPRSNNWELRKDATFE